MKLLLINCAIIFIFTTNSVWANSFNIKYDVKTSGIKIGEFSWSLKIDSGKYKTEIRLKNSSFLSGLYKFKGLYVSSGDVINNRFQTRKYNQKWETRKKTKVVEMLFDDYLLSLNQNPIEKESARINLYELYKYNDPITSFINILNGNKKAETIDGRRVYIMEKAGIDNPELITLEINSYINIWADHKRNDLKKIDFFLMEGGFLPNKIKVYFKNRIFTLKKS